MVYSAKNQKKYEANLSEEEKVKRRKLKQFSATKSFIRLHANQEQLNEIKKLISDVEKSNDR